MKRVFSSDASGHTAQFAQPVEEMFTLEVDAADDVTLEEQTFYTIVSDTNFWWRWGTNDPFVPLIAAAQGGEDSGLWPANKPLKIYTKINTVFAFVKDSRAGYITFYKNYGSN